MDRRRARRTPTQPLVLIVDHDLDTREMYMVALSNLGCDALGAADAAHAYCQAWEARPDVIVTDVALPKTDGWTLVRDLKADPRTRDIPVVVLTGSVAPSLPARARTEGCAAFLLKPCLPEDLVAELRQVLARPASICHATAESDGDQRLNTRCGYREPADGQEVGTSVNDTPRGHHGGTN
jgi:CheY-like chemotaxis protein